MAHSAGNNRFESEIIKLLPHHCKLLKGHITVTWSKSLESLKQNLMLLHPFNKTTKLIKFAGLIDFQ